jgi:hypothetical protein
MSTLFLIVCGVAVVFYAVFLFECSRSVRQSRKAPVVRKSTEAVVIDSATRRFLVHLEQQMAEFLSAQRRAATMLLIGMVLISIPIAASGSQARRTLARRPSGERYGITKR